MGAPWRRPKYQNFQVLGNSVKAVLHTHPNKNRRASEHRTVLIANPDRALALQNVVDLFLGMGSLGVLFARGKNVEPQAERSGPEKLVVWSAFPPLLGDNVGYFEGVHVLSLIKPGCRLDTPESVLSFRITPSFRICRSWNRWPGPASKNSKRKSNTEIGVEYSIGLEGPRSKKGGNSRKCVAESTAVCYRYVN